MAHTSRRRFLQGMGAALASAGVVAGSSALNTTTTTKLNQQAGKRMEIDQSSLATLVIEQLQAWVAVGRSFTAYDVTHALRAHHRQVDIRHAAVRAVVHHRMGPLLARRLYRQEQAVFAGGPAICYMPT